MSKYRSLLIDNGWELIAYTTSDSDGLLRAVKVYGSFHPTPYSLTVSCNQSSDKISCDTTIGSVRGRITKRTLKYNNELEELLDKIKAL